MKTYCKLIQKPAGNILRVGQKSILLRVKNGRVLNALNKNQRKFVESYI